MGATELGNFGVEAHETTVMICKFTSTGSCLKAHFLGCLMEVSCVQRKPHVCRGSLGSLPCRLFIGLLQRIEACATTDSFHQMVSKSVGREAGAGGESKMSFRTKPLRLHKMSSLDVWSHRVTPGLEWNYTGYK